MKKKDFINIVNSLNCEEFSDIPEENVSLVKSRVNEIWSIDETFSLAMNIYKCEDGYVGVRGVCHIDKSYFDNNTDIYNSLPLCEAFEVEYTLKPMFYPIDETRISKDWRFSYIDKQ